MRRIIALCLLAAFLAAGCGEEKKSDPLPPFDNKQHQQPVDKNAKGPAFN